MLNQRIDLIRWKGHRHLRAILKESPVWGERPFFHPSEAAVLEFGANGQFRWIQSPKALGKLDGSRDPIVDELHWVDYRLLDSWDGSAGDFFDDHIFNSMDGNLYVEFPDHPRWMGYLKYKDPSSPPFGEGPSLDFWVIPADIDDEIAEGMGSIILMGLKPRKNQ
ncbi:MAG: hypothetical protein KDN20_20665 [Verrucomicrobiae bacterium]|nr:hypothetical protein [Verrucomicrobiae bacterium]